MSEIRFIEAQGDLLEDAIAQAAAPNPTLLSHVRAFLRPHKRLTLVLVAVLVAGCAAVAAKSLSGSTERLALGRVNCYYGTTAGKPPYTAGLKGVDALGIGATLVNGETPQAWCHQDFAQYSARDLREFGLTPVHNPQLIACRKDATTIAVLISSGSADQCQKLGFTTLPKATTAAFASVHKLGRALSKLYFSRNCWSPGAFTKAVRAIMVAHGLGSWRIIPPVPKPWVGGPPAGTGGDCAVFIYGNPDLGNPYQSLDGVNRTFNFGIGYSHSDYERWNSLGDKLSAETWARCYSPAAASALVDQTFAVTGLTPRIAITAPINRGFRFVAGPPGVSDRVRASQMAKERHFLQGCAIQPFLWIGTNDRFVDVWLTTRHGRFIKFGTYPPPASYFKS